MTEAMTGPKSSAIVGTWYVGSIEGALDIDAGPLPEMPQLLPGAYCFTCAIQADTECLNHHDTNN